MLYLFTCDCTIHISRMSSMGENKFLRASCVSKHYFFFFFFCSFYLLGLKSNIFLCVINFLFLFLFLKQKVLKKVVYMYIYSMFLIPEHGITIPLNSCFFFIRFNCCDVMCVYQRSFIQ